jgi:hypothetical protein
VRVIFFRSKDFALENREVDRKKMHTLIDEKVSLIGLRATLAGELVNK